MSTHRRAWFIRAGIVVLMASASLFGLASPALAANPDVTITSLSSGSLNAGDSATLKFRVKNNNPADTSFVITVTFPGFSGSDVTCTGQCNFTQSIPSGGQGTDFQATIKAGNVGANQTKNGSVKITAKSGSDTKDTDNPLTIIGPPQQQQQTVPEVSGTVVDVFTGQPIDAATVSIQDSANPPHTYSVGTDKNGVYKFTSTADKPIAAGVIAFAVEKNGLSPFPGLTKTANPGQALTGVKLSVAPLSSTASPTNQPPQSTNPQNTATLEPEQTRDVTGGDGGGLSWVLIAIGGVLVLLGIGAIVLLLVRRNGSGDDEEDDGRGGPRGGGPGGRGQGGRGGPGRGGQGGPPGPRRGPGGPGGPAGPGGPGGPYDPTRPMRSPVSPGPRADQTVIAPSPLAGGGQPRGGRPGQQGGPGPNGYGQQYPSGGGGGGGYVGPQGQYGQQAGGDYPGGYDSYNQDQHGQPGYGPRPGGPGQQPDGRRVDWMDD